MWFLQAIPLIGNLFKTVDNVTNAIANERLKLIQAKTDKEKQESVERLQQLETQAAVQVVELNAQNQFLTVVRFVGFGLPAAAAIWKLVIWDKVLGSFAGCAGRFGSLDGCEVFRTDTFDANMWWVVLAAAGFYLLTSKRT